MNVFSKLKDTFIRVSVHNGKIRARQELLRMSERQLADFGFSKELLLEGVSAWPWQIENETAKAAPSLSIVADAKPAVSMGKEKRVIKQAIDELSGYSDRELAELGVTRDGIEEAVRFGRPAVEGVFESHKHAA